MSLLVWLAPEAVHVQLSLKLFTIPLLVLMLIPPVLLSVNLVLLSVFSIFLEFEKVWSVSINKVGQP